MLRHIPMLRGESKHRGRWVAPLAVDSSQRYERPVFGRRRVRPMKPLVAQRLVGPGCETGQEQVQGLGGRQRDP